MRVDDRRDRTRMPGKPLGQEQIPTGPIHIRDRRVPKAVEVVGPVEPGPPLSLPPLVTSSLRTNDLGAILTFASAFLSELARLAA